MNLAMPSWLAVAQSEQGGNQLGAVREHRYPLNTVLAYRWPHGHPLPDTPPDALA